MNFSDALLNLYDGFKMHRTGWNGKDQWVAVMRPEKGIMMTVPYLYLRNAQGDYVPWLPSQGDLFATDWELVA